jgi:hypothetical protein
MDADIYRLYVFDGDGELLVERGFARDAKIEALIVFAGERRAYPERRVELWTMPRGYLLRAAGPPLLDDEDVAV